MIYAGCYTPSVGKNSKAEKRGIEILEWDSGNMLHKRAVTECRNSSWLIINSGKQFVYAVNEEGQGGVTSFLRMQGGELEERDSIQFPGRESCHLCLAPDENYLFVADYGSGDLTVLDCRDGKLSVVQRIEYRGKGSHPIRQKTPHIHSSWILPFWNPSAQTASGQGTLDGQENAGQRPSACGELLVADLGTDRLYRYLIGRDTPLMPRHIQPWIQLPAGSGPRHVAFHWKARVAYVTAELSNQILQICFDEEGMGHVEKSYQLTEKGAESFTSHLEFWPEKKMLYAAVRGTDELIWFSVEDTGELSFKGRCHSGGEVPRHFMVDKKRSCLLVANQRSGNLSILAVSDEGDILPTPIQQIEIPNVGCVVEA